MTVLSYRRFSDRPLDRVIPAPAIVERFNVDGPLGPVLSWTTLMGTIAVSASFAQCTSGPGLARANVDLGSAQHWAQCTIGPYVNNRQNGLAVGMTSAASATAYVGYQDTDLRWHIGRWDAGVYTDLGWDTGPANLGFDILRLVHNGSGTLWLYLRERRVLTVTDPGVPLTGHYAGLFGSSSAIWYQFSAGVGYPAGPWERGLMSIPTINRATRDPHFGALEPDDATITLDNDGSWTRDDVLALRGQPISIESWDQLDAAATSAAVKLTSFTGVISEASMRPGEITVRATSLNLADLATQIPKGTITVEDWPQAVDVGATLAVPLGTAAKIPMLYVRRDIASNVYEYACRRQGTVNNVYRDWHDGYFLVDPSEYTVSYATAGYTRIVFPKQQIDLSGGNHKIYADISFVGASQRNPIRVLRLMLNDPDWGLGRPYDAALFSTAEAAVTAFGGLFCDGYIQEQRAASEYLRLPMMMRPTRIWVDAFGSYAVSVDTGLENVAGVFSDAEGDGPGGILDVSDDLAGEALQNATNKVILRYRRDPLASDTFTMTLSRTALPLPAGQERKEENVLISDTGTADRVADLLAKLEVDGEMRVGLKLGSAGKFLQPRDLIEVTHNRLGLYGRRMRVSSVDELLDGADVRARGTSSRIYAYTPSSSLPADPIGGGGFDASRVAPAAVTSFIKASEGVETLGTDGKVTAFHILQWSIPTGTSPTALAYYSVRIDVKVQFQSIYHVGYATVVSTGAASQSVKISGLDPGLVYDYVAVSFSRLGIQGSQVALNNQLAPGDTTAPAAPAAPTVQAQHLREFTCAVTTGAETDIASLEWDVRTAASGGGSVVISGGGPILPGGGSTTFKFTLPASVPYGSSRFVRCRFKDNSGNPTSPTAGWSPSTSFSALPVATGDLGDGQITTPKIADLNVTTVKLADLNVTTIKLATGAVTQVVFSSISAVVIASEATWTPIVSITMTTTGGVVVGLGSTKVAHVSVGFPFNNPASIQCRLKDLTDGNTSGALEFHANAPAQVGDVVTFTPHAAYVPGAGTRTVQMQGLFVQDVGGEAGHRASFQEAQLTALEFRR